MPNVQRNKSYGFVARRTHRAYDRLLNHYLSPFNIKTGYWYYLRSLWTQDGQSQRELSDENNVAENTTALIIGAMQKSGLVDRTRDLEDKRRWRVMLTPQGKALERDIVSFAEMVNEIGTQGISQKDLDNWLRITIKMAGNLETAFKKVQS